MTPQCLRMRKPGQLASLKQERSTRLGPGRGKRRGSHEPSKLVQLPRLRSQAQAIKGKQGNQEEGALQGSSHKSRDKIDNIVSHKEKLSRVPLRGVDWKISVVHRGGMALISAAVRAGVRLSGQADLLTDHHKLLGLDACSLRVVPLGSTSYNFDKPSFLLLAATPKVLRSELDKTAEEFLKRGTLGGIMLRRENDRLWEARPFGDAEWTEGTYWQVVIDNGPKIRVKLSAVTPGSGDGLKVDLQPCLLLTKAKVLQPQV